MGKASRKVFTDEPEGFDAGVVEFEGGPEDGMMAMAISIHRYGSQPFEWALTYAVVKELHKHCETFLKEFPPPETLTDGS